MGVTPRDLAGQLSSCWLRASGGGQARPQDRGARLRSPLCTGLGGAQHRRAGPQSSTQVPGKEVEPRWKGLQCALLLSMDGRCVFHLSNGSHGKTSWVLLPALPHGC